MQEIEDNDTSTNEVDDDICKLNSGTYVFEYKFIF